MVGGVLSSGIGTFSTGACGQTGGTTAFPSRDGTFGSGSGSIDVQSDCGTVTIAAASGDGWRVEGEDATGAGPDIEATAATLHVQQKDHVGNPFWAFGQRDAWRITVPQAVTTDVDLGLNAGEAAVDLSGALVGDFGLQLNAGSATVDLSGAAAVQRIDIELNAGSVGVTLPSVSMTGTIHANAGAVRLCAQKGVGLKLHTGREHRRELRL